MHLKTLQNYLKKTANQRTPMGAPGDHEPIRRCFEGVCSEGILSAREAGVVQKMERNNLLTAVAIHVVR